MTGSFTVEVPEGAGATVGAFLGKLGVSRGLVRRLKAHDGLLLNGRVATVRDPVQPGDTLELLPPVRETPRIDPEPVPLSIVHEDADLIVLDKPPGTVVHPTHGCHHGTLANGLAHRFQTRHEPAAVHPVHRIDRQTSGLVLFAKHPFAHHQLAEQLAGMKLERTYLAIASGRLAAEDGVVEAPIVRLGGPGGRRAVDPSGQAAVTRWRVLARGPEATLLALQLETGRTHQIRVHTAHLGHPLLGDPLYGPLPPQLDRLALHAHTLSFRHPRTGEVMRLRSSLPPALRAVVAAWPDLPEDLAPMVE